MRLAKRSTALSLAALVVPLLLTCTGGPEIHPSHSSLSQRLHIVTLRPGVELIRGEFKENGVPWAAIRSRSPSGERRLAVATGDARATGDHAPTLFHDADVVASLNGSPHLPVRYRSGRGQEAVGFFRIGETLFSAPNGRHDAVGISPEGRPVLLHPADQANWTGDACGGFYAVLRNGRPIDAVEVRDAVSALGWSEDGLTLIFLAIRGREGYGAGYEEAGALLRDLGASSGLAMDGGGSTRLSWREAEQVESFPPALLYRAVPNFLVIRE